MSTAWARSASGIYAPAEALRARRRPTGIDLFCGAGGFSLGFMDAGFEVLAGLDNEPDCMQTYLHNLGSYPCEIHYVTPEDRKRAERWFQRQLARDKSEAGLFVMRTSGSGVMRHRPDLPPVRHFFLGDARRITGQQILDGVGMKAGEVDVVFGGPPCQGFSLMNKNRRQNVMDPRNSLVFEFARLVLEIRPKAMVMENVPGILSMVTPEGIPVVDAFCRVLEDGGFGTMEALKRGLLSSAGCGAALRSKPKERRRPGDDEQAGEDEQLTLFDRVAE